MNYIFLVGRATENPPIYATNNGAGNLARLSVAVQNKTKNEDGKYGVDFIQVTTFNNIAVNCNKYVQKGDLVSVVGHISTSKYYNEHTGKNEYKTGVIADNVTFLEHAKTKEEPVQGKTSIDREDLISDEDLPF